MKANSAFSRSQIGAIRQSSNTAVTSGRFPNKDAATAACEPIQNRQSLRREVKAAINSRNPAGSGDGPRITPWVNRDRKSVRSGL